MFYACCRPFRKPFSVYFIMFHYIIIIHTYKYYYVWRLQRIYDTRKLHGLGSPLCLWRYVRLCVLYPVSRNKTQFRHNFMSDGGVYWPIHFVPLYFPAHINVWPHSYDAPYPLSYNIYLSFFYIYIYILSIGLYLDLYYIMHWYGLGLGAVLRHEQVDTVAVCSACFAIP